MWDFSHKKPAMLKVTVTNNQGLINASLAVSNFFEILTETMTLGKAVQRPPS
jgi:hypothetical protein